MQINIDQFCEFLLVSNHASVHVTLVNGCLS